jgi:transcriptional regulator with XRE-family HTH domain
MDDNNVAVLDATPDTSPEVENSRYRMDAAAANRACATRDVYTDRDRAALMGVSVKTLYRWRKGGPPPRLDLVDTACRNLGISRHTLFPDL